MNKLNYLKKESSICKLFIIIIFIFLYASVTLAGSKDVSDQKIEKKKTAIIKIMNQGKFKIRNQENQKFCSAFLSDFNEQKNIEHIKPILEVDNYNDSKLQIYFKQCPNNIFNEKIMMSARAAEEIEKKEKLLKRKLTEEELKKELSGPSYFATKNFNLFKVNLDNSNKNGDELVLYAESYRLAIKRQFTTEYTYGGYRIIDLEKCKITHDISTNDPYDYRKQKSIENYNGILRYKDKYYIFDLNNMAGGMLALYKYNEKQKDINIFCRYYLEK